MRSEKEITELLGRIEAYHFDPFEPGFNRHLNLIQDLRYALGRPSDVDTLIEILNKYTNRKLKKGNKF